MPFKIATEAVEGVRKYTSPLGAAWYIINMFFRLGLDQLRVRVCSDDMKEFQV